MSRIYDMISSDAFSDIYFFSKFVAKKGEFVLWNQEVKGVKLTWNTTVVVISKF